MLLEPGAMSKSIVPGRTGMASCKFGELRSRLTRGSHDDSVLFSSSA